MLETISIIIPIYNVESYLRKCLDSIIEQSFPYFELLLINDGSTDASAQICQEYVEKDDRIRYFEKENSGVSSARNFGIKHSRGEYITFIDSDDWIEPNYLEILYKTIKEQEADIVVTNYYTFREEDAMFLFHVAETNEPLVFQPNDSFFNYMFSTFGTDIAWGSSWSKLFKKSLFDRLCFSEDISWAEDFDLMYKLFLISERIIYLHKAPYCYRDRGDSASKAPGEEPICQSLEVSEGRLLTLALAGVDLTEARKHHIGLLQWMKYNMGTVWDMSDTVTFKKIEQQLWLLDLKNRGKST